MKAIIHTHPGAVWRRAKLNVLAAMLAVFCRFGVRIRAIANDACEMSGSTPETKTPASVAAETGELSGTTDQEGDRYGRSNAHGGTPGNPTAGAGVHPALWVSTVNLALAAEIFRLQRKAWAAEAAGAARTAARCRLLAASLTHTAARLADSEARDTKAMRSIERIAA